MSDEQAFKTKSQFCNELDWCNTNFNWFDVTGLHMYPDGRIARLDLARLETSSQHNGFRLTILDPCRGVIDAKDFLFDDYLDRAERQDTRRDYPDHPGAPCYVVYVDPCDRYGWYIAVPRSTRAFCAAIETFIKTYR